MSHGIQECPLFSRIHTGNEGKSQLTDWLDNQSRAFFDISQRGLCS